jgi:hypothetical protein
MTFLGVMLILAGVGIIAGAALMYVDGLAIKFLDQERE